MPWSQKTIDRITRAASTIMMKSASTNEFPRQLAYAFEGAIESNDARFEELLERLERAEKALAKLGVTV